MSRTVVFWSPKGGSGVTVTAAAFAVMQADREDGALPVLVVDATDSSDMSAVLGLPGAGTVESPVVVVPGLEFVEALDYIVAEIFDEYRMVVVDAGHNPTPWMGPGCEVVLVVRGCYMALRQVVRSPVVSTRMVVIADPGRVLSPHDIEQVLGLEMTVVTLDPAVARSVDAGLLPLHLPPRYRKEVAV